MNVTECPVCNAIFTGKKVNIPVSKEDARKMLESMNKTTQTNRAGGQTIGFETYRIILSGEDLNKLRALLESLSK